MKMMRLMFVLDGRNIGGGCSKSAHSGGREHPKIPLGRAKSFAGNNNPFLRVHPRAIASMLS